MRNDQQMVQRVSREAERKQAIFEITEPCHNARRTNPVPMASNALNNRIITLST